MNKPDEALYQNLSKQSEQLSYRNKFRLAQLLIQLARKEEEETYPQERVDAPTRKPTAPETIGYVAERLAKLRPSRKPSLLNAIGAMFQFQGGISDGDKEAIVRELVKPLWCSHRYALAALALCECHSPIRANAWQNCAATHAGLLACSSPPAPLPP